MKADDNAQAPITDDAELAKVLEGMNAPAAPVLPTTATGDLQFEEAPLPTPVIADTPASDPTEPADTPVDTPTPDEPADTTPAVAEPTVVPAPVIPEPTLSVATGSLDSIKKDALTELRPLVDRLNLPADEKFDTLLLIIRSTDDQSLIASAHEAAKSIEDETKRAQALLDVIKEIDYFSSQSAS